MDNYFINDEEFKKLKNIIKEDYEYSIKDGGDKFIDYLAHVIYRNNFKLDSMKFRLVQLKKDIKEFKHLDIIDEIEEIIDILEDNYI